MEQCCGTCAFWGKLNYGNTRSCKAARKIKTPKHWPESVTAHIRFTMADEGKRCSCYKEKDTTQA